jgi:hypothetical protein
MTSRARDLLREVLKLDVKERAELAAEILASVDGEPEADVSAAWLEEIRRREERALGGMTTFEEWEDVRSHLEQQFPKPSSP